MPAPTTGALRWVRSTVCTVVAVALALGAHVLAGGSTPGVPALLMAVVPLACLSVLATGRRIGSVATVGVLVASQAVLHLWFSAVGGPGCGVSGGLSLLVGHHHAAALSPATAGAHALASAGNSCGAGTVISPAVASGALTATPVAAHTDAALGAWMMLAHLAAVVLTGLLLAHGERLLWQAVAGARRVAAAAPGRVVVVRRTPSHVAPSLPTARRLPGARHVRRRGPPAATPVPAHFLHAAPSLEVALA